MNALRLPCVALIVLALAACVRPPGGARPLHEPDPDADAGPDVGAELVFVDRLAVAPATELSEIGAELRSAADDTADTSDTSDTTVALRYALWLATPGHPAYDPAAAQRRLQALLVDDGGLDRELRALVRLQLRYLRRRVELSEENRRLSSENGRLREQIRALTALEEEMGRSGEQQQ